MLAPVASLAECHTMFDSFKPASAEVIILANVLTALLHREGRADSLTLEVTSCPVIGAFCR
jgi:hypothetical protein